ncbi:MAG: ribonuclease domain-containing protein [Burkholderiaceae bacterium]|jgi:ribonuclease T1
MSTRSWFVRFLSCVVLALALPACARDERAPGTEIALRELPREARDTLALIKAGGPFPYRKDGTVFRNREGLLPAQSRGYYTEYTVKTPGERDRGARRIVAGGDPRASGEYWYTHDHYRSFRRIRE